MTQDVIAPSYRGVRCLSCRQPIPLPGIVLDIESSLMDHGSDLPHRDRVFSLRCRACEREKPYRTSDIIDFEGAPTPRLFRPRAHTLGPSNKLARSANG
jgi:hypothetical protein